MNRIDFKADLRARVLGGKIVQSAANMGLRGLGLAARFSITIYLAKYLDLDAVGAFGLIYSFFAILPPVLGFGLNYRVNRELIGMPIATASLRIRDRILMTIITYALAGGAAVLAMHLGLLKPIPFIVLVFFIGLLETMAYDTHFILISLRKPLFANLLMFIRTGSWVFPFIGLGLLMPGLRNFGVLLDFWSMALVATFLVLFFGLRGWPWKKILTAPVDFSWLAAHLRCSGFIYFSDLSIVGAAFLDRFIINFQLGLEETGIFTFYWALANGVQLLVETGVVQISLPRLMDSARSADPLAFGRNIRFEFLKVFVIATILAAAIYVVVVLLVPLLGRPHLSAYPFLFPTMLVAAILRLQSGVISYGLCVRGRDLRYASINVLAVILVGVFTFFGLPVLGIGGIGFAMISGELILLGCRLHGLRGDLFICEPPLAAIRLRS